MASLFPRRSATSCTGRPRCKRVRPKVCRKRCGAGFCFHGPHREQSLISFRRHKSAMTLKPVVECFDSKSGRERDSNVAPDFEMWNLRLTTCFGFHNCHVCRDALHHIARRCLDYIISQLDRLRLIQSTSGSRLTQIGLDHTIAIRSRTRPTCRKRT